jgi:hypothetical protein
MSNDVYRELKKPAYKGQVRRKIWAYLIEPQQFPDELWTKRAREYWGLQEKVYGLKLAGFTLNIDRERRHIHSHAGVLAVLPGKRVKAEHQQPEMAQ